LPSSFTSPPSLHKRHRRLRSSCSIIWKSGTARTRCLGCYPVAKQRTQLSRPQHHPWSNANILLRQPASSSRHPGAAMAGFSTRHPFRLARCSSESWGRAAEPERGHRTMRRVREVECGRQFG
jgi:hypothetical protein